MNKNIQNDMDILVTKYLLQETTITENIIVENWVKESDANKKEMEHLKYLWEKSKNIHIQQTTDENAAWQKLKTRITNREKKSNVFSISNKWWLRAAAAVLVLGVCGLLLKNVFVQTENNIDLFVKTDNNILVDTLPDQSIITLNKNSSIAYNKDFTEENKRSIKLVGEAFFNVTPNKSKPFIIKVNDIEVRVIGTSFNIKTINGQTEVIVKTGIVEVIKNNETLKLSPQEKVITNANTALIKTTYTDKLFNYYQSKEFVCEETPLWRLVEVLNDAYNANISINNKNIANLTITSTFANESLDNILQIVATTLQIEVVRESGKIILQ